MSEQKPGVTVQTDQGQRVDIPDATQYFVEDEILVVHNDQGDILATFARSCWVYVKVAS